MNGLPYYRAYPRDFLEGTVGLPFEVKCAYRVILDLIYLQNGRLPDDARYIAGQLGCSVRKWTAIREALIEASKITAEGGIISNFRADNEIETSRKFQDKQRENASNPKKNKGLPEPKESHTSSLPSSEEKRPSVSRPNDEVRTAFDLWNDLAERRGLAKARELSDGRRARLRARLKRSGLDGWREALTRLERSAFCLGLKTDWKADLDFVLQEKSFTKLIEGSYGDDAPTAAPAPVISPDDPEIRRQRRLSELSDRKANGTATDEERLEFDRLLGLDGAGGEPDAEELSGRPNGRHEPSTVGERRGRPRAFQGPSGQRGVEALDEVSPFGGADELRVRGSLQPAGRLVGQILAGARSVASGEV